ncbi:uncharacterized protein LOC134577330 [Pelobates fuscus]|uniref:uncharacterized protein LOC134577330 n=1 Tax=Pelobates fuscus TaxID=191477 RepID=UPI002FE46694
MGSLLLGVTLFILNIGTRFCEIVVEQDRFISGSVDSTVNLSCHLKHGAHEILRVNPYWIINKTGEDVMYLYPPNNPTLKNRVKEINKDHMTDMTILVSRLELTDTETYHCFVSLLVNSSTEPQSMLVSGNGTMLFVHGPVEVEFNDTEIMCKTQVRWVENVSLVWEYRDKNLLIEKETQTWVQALDGSLWIMNRLEVKFENFVGNTTFYCQLNHDLKYNIASKGLEIPGRGPIQVEMNESEIICQVQVGMMKHVSLDWYHRDQNLLSAQDNCSQYRTGSNWITNCLKVQLEQCVGDVTFYCQLSYSSKPIANESLEIPCRGVPQIRHPVLLYSLLLGTSFLILMIVILISLKMRQCKPRTRQRGINLPRYKFI